MHMDSAASLEKEIDSLEQELMKKKKDLANLRTSLPNLEVENYIFKDENGKDVSLLSLFQEKDELILIHNMGKSCSYCTMWADGFNGVLPHLNNKASFVVASPNDYETQSQFAKERGWTFKMVSTKDSTFTKDMGFQSEDGSFYPGVSVFVKNHNGQISRHAKAPFGPGDDYCIVWPLFDLLPSGSEDWHPKKAY
ncbi:MULTISPECIES: DUF899 family protein [Bacillus]|uniref:Dithiol-disulfide oxidoreductase (DUF899 family) n=1 Tax=Bacillus capparidis TaxID=1840411 RepID=A0ABS4CWF2_9BACI|nr:MULTISPECIES: DUF899 family protein [Bacillus]MBP1081918.1 putative dithiol-disulfide oxidoreductase (DUF899 family) [Bacillus capparidis]MED1096565.1 DUF899 family protein [Bacillus capparidis]